MNIRKLQKSLVRDLRHSFPMQQNRMPSLLQMLASSVNSVKRSCGALKFCYDGFQSLAVEVLWNKLMLISTRKSA